MLQTVLISILMNPECDENCLECSGILKFTTSSYLGTRLLSILASARC